MLISEREAGWIKANWLEIAQIPDEIFERLLGSIHDIVSINSRSRADQYVAEHAQSWFADEKTIRLGMAWVTLCANTILLRTRDEVMAEVKNLISVEPDLEEKRIFIKRVIQISDATTNDIDHIRMVVKRRNATKGLSPYFDDISATVELRAVFDSHEAAMGFLDAENVSIVGLEPVASIRLELDSGFPSEFSFQADRQDLNRMIVLLSNLRMRMEELAKLGESIEKGGY